MSGSKQTIEQKYRKTAKLKKQPKSIGSIVERENNVFLVQIASPTTVAIIIRVDFWHYLSSCLLSILASTAVGIMPYLEYQAWWAW